MVTARSNRLSNDERQIVDVLYQPLRRYAAVVGPIEMEPDDLVQEALLQALRRGPLTELDNPGAYLRRTIVNLAANERRRLGRLRRAVPRLAVDDVHEVEIPPDVSELLALTPRERAVLFLAHVEGFSFGDIAEMVGSREAATRKWLRAPAASCVSSDERW